LKAVINFLIPKAIIVNANAINIIDAHIKIWIIHAHTFSQEEIQYIFNVLDLTVSKSESKIFKILVKLYQNKLIKVNFEDLRQISQLTGQTIHSIIQRLIKKNYIKKIDQVAYQRTAFYTLNLDQLNILIEDYKIKQELKNLII
jgi:DNA-binding MarR family transcriptional regulator